MASLYAIESGGTLAAVMERDTTRPLPLEQHLNITARKKLSPLIAHKKLNIHFK
jgi:hypothetical protein